MKTARTYPGPKFSNPRDAARFAAWRLARRAAGLSPVDVCSCGCGWPSTACPNLNASNVSE